ncbi:MAG: class I SAM-dependent methyltransferase [Bacillota bacterium]|nr:class I SAM-dependent methyltransferase [Bacillota bacterium]
MTEAQWDKKLKIRTMGRIDSHADTFHYPYEPTPYTVLERLAEQGYIRKENILLDYGCGKGRVGLFLHYAIGCKAIGLEYDRDIFLQAEENRKTAVRGQGVTFTHADAAAFVVEDADRFYFFNPFSVEILQSVMGRIQESYYEKPRRMLLFFYYPNDEYLVYLMAVYALSFLEEIDCRDLFAGKDERERILVFEWK